MKIVIVIITLVTTDFQQDNTRERKSRLVASKAREAKERRRD
jgi:hypothetical protein